MRVFLSFPFLSSSLLPFLSISFHALERVPAVRRTRAAVVREIRHHHVPTAVGTPCWDTGAPIQSHLTGYTGATFASSGTAAKRIFYGNEIIDILREGKLCEVRYKNEYFSMRFVQPNARLIKFLRIANIRCQLNKYSLQTLSIRPVELFTNLGIFNGLSGIISYCKHIYTCYRIYFGIFMYIFSIKEIRQMRVLMDLFLFMEY